MFHILGYVAKTNEWLDQKGQRQTPKLGDQIDIDICDRGWEEIIKGMGFGLTYVGGQAKIVKKG